jgi:DNA topoisomerase I
VALRLIVDREKEIAAFKPDEYWEVDVLFSLDSQQAGAPKVITGKSTPKYDTLGLSAQLQQENKEAEESAQNESNKPTWLEETPEQKIVARVVKVDSKKFEPSQQDHTAAVTDVLADATASHQIKDVERKERKRSSLPPFTTSTLQQQAATRLGMTSKQSMRLAQQLYEEGLITYHRTDSVNLSQQALTMARDYVGKLYGDEYLPEKPRSFANKSKNAQEAHEAIRVTNASMTAEQVISQSAKMTERHKKLYELIWRRYLASQMKPAIYDQTAILVESTSAASTAKVELRTSGSVLKFDGWMKLFPARDDKLLPNVDVGQSLGADEIYAAQKYTLPPSRYNDASLVKELEKRGIGRPSTYASIISVIADRGYVTRDAKRFIATPVGVTVCDFLIKHFEKIMDYDFTAEMEEDLDRVARNEKEWKQILRDFYKPFAKKIAAVEKDAERSQIPVEKTGEFCPTCADLVTAGELPKADAGEIVIRSGRFGKFKSCSRFPDCKFTKNIVEILEGQNCPLCTTGDIVIKKSRWGKPFYGCGSYPTCDWASWKKPEPGLKVTKAEWAQTQKERAERIAKRKKKADSKTGAKKSAKKKPKKKAAKKTTKKAVKKTKKAAKKKPKK